jgi:hypothetical protein
LPRSRGVFSMLAFVVVFLIATYAVSQLTSLAPRVLRGTVSPPDVLLGTAYLAATVFSVIILGRMIYSSERAAGRVKRRIKLFE